jgi:diguanylate cyclase (GGDEF)-like protein
MTGRHHLARGARIAGTSDAALVEVVRGIQSLVASGAPPTVIYEAVLDGALALLDGDGGSLRFVDLEDPSWSEAVASRGAAGNGERWRNRAPITEGLSGRVISTGRPAKTEGPQASNTGSQLAPGRMEALIGAPINEHGVITGSLVVSTTRRGRVWSEQDLELLMAFSDHIAVAVNVAKANQAVQQSLSDPLTGLANRRMMLDRLRFELARADRGGHAVTVLFLDLDGFKLVNDSLGHSIGDKLLIAVGERLRESIGQADICARLGGDEFAILLVGKDEPAQVATRIIEALERRFVIADEPIFVSVSIGIVTGRDDAETLLRQADVAMYQAKQTGRGRYMVFEPSMQAVRHSRLALTTELRQAIARDEIQLHYQPLEGL